MSRVGRKQWAAVSTKRGPSTIPVQKPSRSPPRAFLVAAYDSFEFLARNPGIGRSRADLGFPEVRSWHVDGFRRYLIFYRELPDRIQIWRVLHGARDLLQSLVD